MGELVDITPDIRIEPNSQRQKEFLSQRCFRFELTNLFRIRPTKA